MPAPVCGYYTRLIASITEFYLRPLCNEILAAFLFPADILDLGTGTGQLPIMLAQGNSGYRVTGIDLSETGLRLAREQAVRAAVADRVQFVRANIEKGSPELRAADLVVSTCSLHHWRHPVRMLRGAARLLKENGEIWLVDDFAEVANEARRRWVARVESAAHAGWLFRTVFQFESRFLAYSRTEIETMCRRAGLCIVEFRTRDVFFQARILPVRSIRTSL